MSLLHRIVFAFTSVAFLVAPMVTTPSTPAEPPQPLSRTGAVLLQNQPVDGVSALPLASGPSTLAVITASAPAEAGNGEPSLATQFVSAAEQRGHTVNLVDLGGLLDDIPDGAPLIPGEVLASPEAGPEGQPVPGALVEYFAHAGDADAVESAIAQTALAPQAKTEGVELTRLSTTLTAPVDGTYSLSVSGSGTTRLFVDDAEAATPYTVDAVAGDTFRVVAEQDAPTDDPSATGQGAPARHPLAVGWTAPAEFVPSSTVAAVEAASAADAVVVIAEGGLPVDHAGLFAQLAAANPRLIVVGTAAADPGLAHWLSSAAAILDIAPGVTDAIPALFGDTQPVTGLEQAIAAPPAEPVEGTGHAADDAVVPPLFAPGFGLRYWDYRLDGASAAVDPAAGQASATVNASSLGTADGLAAFEVSTTGDEPTVIGKASAAIPRGAAARVTIPLDVSGLPAGTHTIVVSGKPGSTSIETTLAVPKRAPDGSRPVATHVQGIVLPEQPGPSLAMTIDPGGVELASAGETPDLVTLAGTLPTVTIVDNRPAGPTVRGWTVSAVVTDLTGEGGVLSADELGWTPRLLSPADGITAGPTVVGSHRGGPGLVRSAVLGTATGNARTGPIAFGADLSLETGADAAPGTYTGVLTVTLFPLE